MRQAPLSVNLEQGSNEWLSYRRNKIMASDAPILMNESPWGSPYSLWTDKLGLNPPREVNSAMQRGKDLEPIILEAAERRLQMRLKPAVLQHPIIKYMGASVDAISEDGKTVCEFKTAGRMDHDQVKDGIVPKKYIGQLNHILEVCGLEKILYCSYSAAGEILYYTYERDDKYIGHMLQREEEFWLCMQEFSPPPMLDCDFRIRDDEKWEAMAYRYQYVTKQLKELEKEQEILKQALIQEAKDMPTKGGGVRLAKQARKGFVQYDKVPQLIDVDLELYRKPPTTYWRVT
jgi:putative phage-type endonuclease